MYNDFYDSGSRYAIYSTRTFAQIFESFDIFNSYYTNGMIPALVSEDNVRTLYYLLYARYGNSCIANSIDENQFIVQVMSIIFQYGPTWEKKLEIQARFRALTEDDILTGSEEMYNTALNPSTAPTQNGKITTINQQNVTYRKRDRMNAYAMLTSLLETDITSDFLDKFKNLFSKIITPVGTVLYPTYLEENEND